MDKMLKDEQKYLVNTYSRPPFILKKGKGIYLYDLNGNKYLDFISGIAVNALGYGNSGIQKVLEKQSKKLWHCSNLFLTEPPLRLAKLLVNNSFADRVFFCNSGAEAVEGAIKFARKWAKYEKSNKSSQIIAFKGSFHGRTMGALSATGQPKLCKGFEPLLPGFRFADFNRLESVKSIMNENVCAILVEPVQGEGGIHIASKEFIRGLRKLCDEFKCLLIFDEVQCGMGRTGKFFAYQHYSVEPDMVTLAKALGGGLPLGAILLKDSIGTHIKPGDHGSTFGGGPLICSVSEYVVKRMISKKMLNSVLQKGNYMKLKLQCLKKDYPEITDVRALGLMIGIDLTIDVKKLVEHCYNNSLLIAKAGDHTVRFLPPLIIQKSQIDEGIKKFENALNQYREAFSNLAAFSS